MKDTKVASSGQGNYYGALDLVVRDDGHYLRMQCCSGDDFTGPLTTEQVEAFCTLFEVEPSLELGETTLEKARRRWREWEGKHDALRRVLLHISFGIGSRDDMIAEAAEAAKIR
jgi:hypothetical protein